MQGCMFRERLKMVMILVLSFFGAAFTLMAYHNDIAIAILFSQVYESLLGATDQVVTEVEICYCIGIACGAGGYLKYGR